MPSLQQEWKENAGLFVILANKLESIYKDLSAWVTLELVSSIGICTHSVETKGKRFFSVWLTNEEERENQLNHWDFALAF